MQRLRRRSASSGKPPPSFDIEEGRSEAAGKPPSGEAGSVASPGRGRSVGLAAGSLRSKTNASGLDAIYAPASVSLELVEKDVM